MTTLREKISLTLLTGLFMVCSLRYYPDHPRQTALVTGQHLLTLAPFLVGTALITNALFQRLSGDKPSRVNLFRIGLTLGITIEFILGIYHYLAINS
ncbi:MAG: hypothetical protein KJ950_14200 [Proteobacteria bacterium]|nr:hypothetical protein [Pseudomonadota bacterium]MBU1685918.1 hypothetical protein [Pseudomonadota bacterium]